MFKCQGCNKSIADEKINRKVIEKRDKLYKVYVVIKMGGKNVQLLSQEEVNEIEPEVFKTDYKVLATKDYKGWEIKKELKLCKDCFLK